MDVPSSSTELCDIAKPELEEEAIIYMSLESSKEDLLHHLERVVLENEVLRKRVLELEAEVAKFKEQGVYQIVTIPTPSFAKIDTQPTHDDVVSSDLVHETSMIPVANVEDEEDNKENDNHFDKRNYHNHNHSIVIDVLDAQGEKFTATNSEIIDAFQRESVQLDRQDAVATKQEDLDASETEALDTCEEDLTNTTSAPHANYEQDPSYSTKLEWNSSTSKKMKRNPRVSKKTKRNPSVSEKMKRPTNRNKSSIERKYICKQCGKSFSQQRYLDQHQIVHEDRKRYKCEDCGKQFLSKHGLKDHKNLVHKGVRQFQCDECGQEFKRRGDLNNHMLVHSEVSHACDKCEKTFKWISSLREHMKKHAAVDDENIKLQEPCTVCGKLIGTRSMRTHMLIHTEKSHQCPECEKSFARPAGLKLHMMVHTGQKNHACSQCTKKFRQKSDLNVHMMSHTGVKSHFCDYCGMGFISPRHLRAHLPKHSGVKSFTCTHCDKDFTYRKALLVHIKSQHGPEKPKRTHPCSVCANSFSTSSSLSRHMRRIHMIHSTCSTHSHSEVVECDENMEYDGKVEKIEENEMDVMENSDMYDIVYIA